MDGSSVFLKYDLGKGTSEVHDFGPTIVSGEPVFVPAANGTAEDDGYVITYLYDKATQSSSFVVLDAHDMSAEPLAIVPLPQRVPFGFHGSWIAD